MSEKSKEMWFFPRRADLNEFAKTIGLLKKKEFRKKFFTPQKQERLASLLDQKNITKSVYGRISPSSVRTLVANIDYFFPIRKREGRRKKIKISKVADMLPNYKNRKAIFEHQLLKLQITNPKIEKSCKNVRVFPYQVILKLLLELNELTFEEIGYFLLRYKGNQPLAKLKENIEEFRKNPDKDKIIKDYKSTAEGKWALRPSAMANYVMNFCATTGTCKIVKRSGVKKLELKDCPEKVKKRLSRFSYSPFEFKSEKVFNIYMGDPDIIRPPKVFDIKITDKKGNPAIGAIIKIIRKFRDALEIVDKKGYIHSTLFPERMYNYEVYDKKGNQVDQGTIEPLSQKPSISVSLTPISEKLGKAKIANLINQLVSSSDYDEILKLKLDVLKKVSNYRVRSKKRLRGGRLEHLFFLLFKCFQNEGLIDELVWNGKVDERGIPNPALGGKPDLIVEIDEKLFVLEVTLIKDIRSQWQKEGASVPEHIEETKKEFGRDVIGIFVAPQIHNANKKNLKLIVEGRGTRIGFRKIRGFVSALVNVSNKKDLKSVFTASLKL